MRGLRRSRHRLDHGWRCLRRWPTSPRGHRADPAAAPQFAESVHVAFMPIGEPPMPAPGPADEGPSRSIGGGAVPVLFATKRVSGAVLALLVVIVYAASATGASTSPQRTQVHKPRVVIKATVRGALYPRTVRGVTMRLINRSRRPVIVTAVLPGARPRADRRHPRCKTTGVTFRGRRGLRLRVKRRKRGRNGVRRVTLRRVVRMSNASANGCQGATFTIPVKARVRMARALRPRGDR